MSVSGGAMLGRSVPLYIDVENTLTKRYPNITVIKISYPSVEEPVWDLWKICDAFTRKHLQVVKID
jgi:hypothetical protein